MSHGGSRGAGPRDTGGIWINTRSRGWLSQPPPARLKTARVFAGGISQSSRSAWTRIWRTKGGSCAVRSRTPGRRLWPSPRKRRLRLRDAAAPSAPEAGTRAPAVLFCPVEPEPAPGRPVPPRVPLCEQGRHFYPPAHCRATLRPCAKDGRSKGEREAALGRMAFVPTRTGGTKKVRDKGRGSHSVLPAGQHRPATRVGSSLAGIILSPCGSTRGSGLERIPTCRPLPRVTVGICPSLRIIARR